MDEVYAWDQTLSQGLLVDVEHFGQIADLIAGLQQELEQQLPNADIKVWKFMLGRGGGKKIEAAFRGPDPLVLRRLADDTGGVVGQEKIAGRLLAPDSVITGPILTHVNEFRALLIEAEITPSR